MAGDGKTKDGLSSTEYPRIAAAASNVGLTLEEQWKKVTSDIVSKRPSLQLMVDSHQEEWKKVTTEVLEKSGAIKEKEEEASKKKAEIKAGVLSVIKELEGKAQSKW